MSSTRTTDASVYLARPADCEPANDDCHIDGPTYYVMTPTVYNTTCCAHHLVPQLDFALALSSLFGDRDQASCGHIRPGAGE